MDNIWFYLADQGAQLSRGAENGQGSEPLPENSAQSQGPR